MKVTLLGHASVLVEMDGARCLMDPVFQDPFEDTAVVSCPRRDVHVEKLPPIDVLVISHAHLDHFDIPSLARIRRDAQVLCPKDQTIVYALQQLGFQKINAAEPSTRLALGRHELLTTHSNVTNVIEFGVVFKDRSGVFWNQVDTVVAPETCALALEAVQKVDLLFAMYASQNFGFFESRPVAFPYATHEMNLRNVLAIRPVMAVPGSAGFRFEGPGMDWCNSFLFPMARERFIEDLSKIAPHIQTRIANPGDTFEISEGSVNHTPASSPYATTIADDTALLRFDSTRALPALRDVNPDGYSTEHLSKAVEECMDGFLRFVDSAFAGGDPVVDEYKRFGVGYAVAIVFPDDDERWYRLDFSGAELRIETGAPAANRAVPPDALHRIVASALASRAAHDKSYFYLRAFSRKTCNVYALSADNGNVCVQPKELRDLLEYYLLRKAPGAELAVKRWLDLQLKPYLRAKA